MKISFDTSIAVYSCNESSPEQPSAIEFLSSLALRQYVVISEFMLVELYLKLRNAKIFREPMCPRSLKVHHRWSLSEGSKCTTSGA